MPRQYHYKSPPSHQTYAAFDVKVHGEAIDDLITAKGWLDANMKQEVYSGLIDVAMAWHQASRSIAPERTGELRRSISVRTTREGIFMNAKARHAGWVHFGTKYQAAQPFIQEGWQAIGGNIREDLAIKRGTIHRRVNEETSKAIEKSGIAVE